MREKKINVKRHLVKFSNINKIHLHDDDGEDKPEGDGLRKAGKGANFSTPNRDYWVRSPAWRRPTKKGG